MMVAMETTLMVPSCGVPLLSCANCMATHLPQSRAVALMRLYPPLMSVHSLATFCNAHYIIYFLSDPHLPSHTHNLSLVMSAVFCGAETTGFLSWPDTLPGTTCTLHCPTTTTTISRTWSLSGVWENVDPSLCTLFTVSVNLGFSIVYAFKIVYTWIYILTG